MFIADRSSAMVRRICQRVAHALRARRSAAAPPAHVLTGSIDHSAAPARSQLHSGAMPARALQRWLLMLVAVFALAACSSLRLGYNNADTLLMYAADSYLDLDSEQDAFARERVRALLVWHRRTQLREYARLLEAGQRRLDGTATQPLSAAEVLAFQRQGAEHMLTVGRQAAPDLVRLSRMLKPEQLDYLGNKLAKDTDKLKRERRVAVSTQGGAVSEARIEANLERARTWLGRVTPEQERLIREAALATPAAERRWIEARERRQRALVALMQQVREPTVSPEAGAALMNRHFAEIAEPADPAQRAATLAAREANAHLLAQVLNVATPEQKAHLIKKLRGYASDLTVLASEGAPG
jgi:hypothetical protein